MNLDESTPYQDISGGEELTVSVEPVRLGLNTFDESLDFKQNLNGPRDSDHLTELKTRIKTLESELFTIKRQLTVQVAPETAPITAKKDSAPHSQDVAEFSGGVKVTHKRVIVKSNGTTIQESGEPPTFKPSNANHQESNPAMCITEFFNKENKRASCEIQILSTKLVHLMRKTMNKVIEHQGAWMAWKQPPVIVDTGSWIIWHCFEDLRASAAVKNEITEAQKELGCFLKYLEYYQPDYLKAQERVKSDRVIMYNSLPVVFTPGSKVVAKPFKDSPQIFVVHQLSVNKEKTFITCWSYDWDGKALVRSYYDFVIASYNGARSIRELPCYPIELYNENGKTEADIWTELVERGKRFRNLCTSSSSEQQPLFQTSSFLALEKDELSSPHRIAGLRGLNSANFKEVKSEPGYKELVIIDPLLCKRYAWVSYIYLGDLSQRPREACYCSLCSWDGELKLFETAFNDGNFDLKFNDSFYALLPPRLHGFIVTHKTWAQIHVDAILEEDHDKWDKAWDELAMPRQDGDEVDGKSTHKANIKALVENHFRRVAQPPSRIDVDIDVRDLVARKGEGVVILLHGIPGVGKTMTAEALALSLRRRLLRIDAADFEYNKPAQVSEVFKRYFHMCSSWGALLLLDEADVFLQERKRRELDQNALVSILLRELEYFQGVLIMTTNRIVSLDYAVQSRIHYAVRFDELQLHSIERIWETFSNQLNKNNCTNKEPEGIALWFKSNKKYLRNAKFTGRDIRNVFIVAQLLNYPYITKDNIDRAANSTIAFRQAMKDHNQRMIAQSVTGDE